MRLDARHVVLCRRDAADFEYGQELADGAVSNDPAGRMTTVATRDAEHLTHDIPFIGEHLDEELQLGALFEKPLDFLTILGDIAEDEVLVVDSLWWVGDLLD